MSDLGRYLDRLQAELDEARQRFTQENADDAFHFTLAASHLAKLQRLSSHALHAAVTGARDHGTPWEFLAAHAQVYVEDLKLQARSADHRVVVDGMAARVSDDGRATVIAAITRVAGGMSLWGEQARRIDDLLVSGLVSSLDLVGWCFAADALIGADATALDVVRFLEERAEAERGYKPASAS